MRLLYQLFCSGALLLTSCGQTSSTDRHADAPVKTPTATLGARPDTNLTSSPTKALSASSPATDTLHVVSDKLVEQFFKTLAYQRVRPDLNHLNQKVELTPSADDASITDSIITYKAGRNSFTYLKSGINDTSAGIIHCRITAPPTHLPAGITLGMSRSALARLLGATQPITAEVVQLTEQEGYQRFYFVFKNGGLRAVSFESYYLG